MVQTRIEERLEQINREISAMKKEISKMPAVESSLSKISRNLDLMRTQSEKQQQMLLLMMESFAKERSIVSEKTTDPITHESAFAKGKEKKTSTNKPPDTIRNAEEGRVERKADNDELSTDRSKFKKVDMPVFTREDTTHGYFEQKDISKSIKSSRRSSLSSIPLLL
ncbi:histone-lysine N-methyltransferase ASHR1 isoform X3 [Cucumis melo var. makuwa]|uniref:Histone-lysine N-methyltransferase ASHR1 isoform X3 n=1 Tax=Cucumis melo var. makuwa TaxID=1194695 RepID=A0A5A7VAK9_CUCMM|nr:histone-lysine N-methyltransferase ASHR1 isoform X3 [Cucumis melo var. makuwa]